MSVTRVLVTGASGFIAQHCIAELLRTGHSVRGTLRYLARAGDARAALARAGVDAAPVEFAAADLSNDAGWDEAVKGCSHVLHVASPFPIKMPRKREELVAPARDGALRLLAAATRAGVRRVVLTSSMYAMIYAAGDEQSREYTEADWTDTTRTDITPYVASKTLAEKAAWNYVRDTLGAPELTVINPGFVHGAALSTDLSTSHELVRRLATGGYPAAPRSGFAVADVCDVAEAHVVAMTHPHAAGERFLVSDVYMTMLEIGQAVGNALPDVARRVPDWTAPDFLVRALSLFDASVEPVLPDLGVRRACSNAKARNVLGLQIRSGVEAVKTSATSLRSLGVI
jgi:nucleoside-diphosphate-sugar epimerase